MKLQIPQGWYETARREFECYNIHLDYDQEEKVRRGTQTIDAFHDLFVYLAAKLQLRDEWPEPHCHIAPFSTGIIERSRRMRVDFTLGLSLYGWFIKAPIRNADQIRLVRDDYWTHIAKLASLGKAELEDYGRPLGWTASSEAKKLVQHKVSLVYSIARDYTLLSLDPESERVDSLGAIHIQLPVETDEARVLEFYLEALDGLYRSSSLLYRSAYLQRRRSLKRLAKKHPHPDEWAVQMLETLPRPLNPR